MPFLTPSYPFQAKDIISNTNKIGVYGAAPGKTHRTAAIDEVMHPIRDTREFRNLDRTHEYCSKLDTTYFVRQHER